MTKSTGPSSWSNWRTPLQATALICALAFFAIAVRAYLYGIETWPWPTSREELIRPTSLSEATAQILRYIYTNLAASVVLVGLTIALRRRS